MRDWIIVGAIVAVFAFGVKKCTDTEWYQEGERQTAAQEAAERQPHVIREADGCKVYAFKANDSLHYFTRCSNSTVATERNWREQQGKRTVDKRETITTGDGAGESR
ncbi:MAG TPA: hypothetical protein VMT67_01025 [Terriglobales bacterium]|nr:hypothetical protein [Terriglobales bacterium]